MKGRSVFLIAAGAALMAVFAIPAFHLIVNIGNLTGFAVSALVFLYGLFFAKINEALGSCWRIPAARAVLILAGATAGGFAVLAVIMFCLMATGFSKQPAEGSTVIVLGCDVVGQGPGPMMKDRLDRAYEYLGEHPDIPAIVAGGIRETGEALEADVMYDYLISKGVAAYRLYKEDRSVSTYENIIYSEEIIAREGMDPRLALVTSEFHEYRANRMAAKLGYEAGAVPVRTKWWLWPTYFIRECAGILYWWLFGV